MPDYSRSLGKTVRTARAKKRFTQNQVAEKIDIDNRTLINIENNRGNPKMEVLYPLVRLLEIDPNHIFYPEVASPHPALIEIQSFLANCSDEELRILLPICETIIEVFRSNN